VDKVIKGTIFNIERFATGDGPGIRTLVFLKGCPLSCKWCSNPESQKTEPEIIYYQNKCSGCKKCLESCPEKAISHDQKLGFIVDRKKCTACGKCVEVCYYDARDLSGKQMTVFEIIEIINKDKKYYDNSGGGVTLSGGEPLLQPEFTRELLRACKKRRIHTALETSGFSSWEHFKSIIPYLDLIFFDFKHIDSESHYNYTGVRNEKILKNLENLDDKFTWGDIIVRIPFIPGFNSNNETQRQMFKYIGRFKNIKRIEIMPYHRLGILKYSGLGRDYDLPELKMVHKSELNHLINIGQTCGIKVKIDAG
jgi:pyruvate formate lyase activating enzyme